MAGVIPQRRNAMGELEPEKPLRSLAERLTFRRWTRVTPLEPVRGHKGRGAPIGLDPLEQRALQGIVAPITERIVYKTLAQMIGPENFIWQFDIQGGRQVFHSVFVGGTLLGGFILDFVILNRTPPLAIEVQGSYWHGTEGPGRDVARQIAVNQFGFDYAEIWDYQIYAGQQYLEDLILRLLGTRPGGQIANLRRRLPAVKGYIP